MMFSLTSGPYESAVSIKFTPSSTARFSTLRASARSFGSPQIPAPVMRMAPKPSRLMVRSPPSAKVSLVSVGNVVISLEIRHAYDWFLIVPRTATIVGAGPNGLAAAIVMAGAGFAVDVREAASVPGGAARSAELTLPGFIHDLGSAVHPMAVASPFFSTLPLAQAGLHWISPSAELAHPLDDGTAVMLERDIGDTASQLGTDAAGYRRLYGPLLANWDGLRHDLLKAIGWPGHPIAMARFGFLGFRSPPGLAHSYLPGVHARALFAGLSAP